MTTLRPPVFEERTCGRTNACGHYQGLDGECRHPLARDRWGHLVGMYRYLPEGTAAWPRPAATDWCGFWRPAEVAHR